MAHIGLIGLGTMGSALALNIAEKGFDIAVWNRTGSVTEDFVAEAGDLAARITGTQTLEELVAAIERPRAIILMVPAGQPVDDQIAALRPLLDADDLIIDAGNANFSDTNRRVAESGGPFLGIGVSGGEEGARHGPSIMGGGKREDWDRVAPVRTAIAADYQGTPCATWMGEEGAGHFVKAVHNGIEYADMAMIAEVYGLMRDGMGMTAAEIGAVFTRWNEGPLQSYLVEISGKVASAVDPVTGGPLLDVIVDAAGQKGTGRWTVVEAQHLGAPIPAIDMAVAARNMSARIDARRKGAEAFGGDHDGLELSLEALEQALIAGKVFCYAQGFEMIKAASDSFGWALPLPEIAKVWRAGCIIRSAMLDDMARALEAAPGQSLIFSDPFTGMVRDTEASLRKVVCGAMGAGLPVVTLASGVGYFDTMRQARGTADMIQGQRDFFGLHGFVRRDTGESGQHGPWA